MSYLEVIKDINDAYYFEEKGYVLPDEAMFLLSISTELEFLLHALDTWKRDPTDKNVARLLGAKELLDKKSKEVYEKMNTSE